MDDSIEHTVRETSPTPLLCRSLQGPLLRRNADTPRQQWGGKDEECSGNQVSYGMGSGGNLVWFSTEWRAPSSSWANIQYGFIIHSDHTSTEHPCAPALWAAAGLTGTHPTFTGHTVRQTTTMTTDVKEGRFQLCCIRQNTLKE